jgi:hypothetical protein
MTDVINVEERIKKEVELSIRAIFNKNNCFDVLKNIKLEGHHIYEPMLNKPRLQLKKLKSLLLRHYHKINLVIRLRSIDKILLIRARLKIIEIVTRLFMLDVQ